MSTDQTHVLLNRNVLINTIINYIGKFINLIIWFFLTPFILAHLGSDIYGLWILVGSLAAYGSLFDLGIASAITKYVAEYSTKGEYERAQKLVATSLSLYSVLGVIVFLTGLVVAPFFPILFNIPQEQHTLSITLVILSGLAVGLSIPCTLASAVLRGLQRFDLINLITVTGTLLSTTLMVSALKSGGGVLSLVIISISVNLLMQIPSIWLIHYSAPELRIGWRGSSRYLVKQVSSFSLALFVLNLNGFLETKTDEIVIGAYLPLTSVTPYNIALRLSSLPQMLASQFIFQILPLASATNAKNDETKIRALYLSSMRITMALFLPIGLVICILASPILSLWVGPKYAGYAYLVIILTLASFIDTSQWPAGLILQGMARHKLLALVSLLSGITNLVISITFVQIFGLAGVAFGTLIPTTLICIFFVFPYSMRLLKVQLKAVFGEVLLPVLIPALPTIISLYVLKGLFEHNSPFSLLVIIAISLLIYSLSYLSMKTNSIERNAIHKMISKTVLMVKVFKQF